MFNVKSLIKNKLALTIGAAAVAVLVVLLLLLVEVRRLSALQRDMALLNDIRVNILSLSVYSSRMEDVRQYSGTADEAELNALIKELLTRTDSMVAEVMGATGEGDLPEARNEQLAAQYIFFLDLWPLFQEAARRVLQENAARRNLEFMEENTPELSNRVAASADYHHQLVTATNDRIWWYSVALLLLTAGFVSALLYAVYSRFIRPINSLGEHLSSIGGTATPYEVVLPYEDNSEIGRLSKLINRFIERMREADQMKDRFLANMSHEIRTPLNGIVGFLENLADTPLNEQQSQYVRVIRSSSRALLKVINDVLDFSKISAGRMELESVAFDLNALLEEVVSMAGELAKRKNLKMNFSFEKNGNSAVVRGDPTRLRQVLNNLLNNAVKFTERGEVRLKATMTQSTEDSSEYAVTVVISDTGAGMTPEQQKRLFIPFTQADSSMTRKHGGTGLGLCIASNLVSLMGGELKAESQVGTGSRFWFQIVLPPAPEEEQVRLTQHYNIKFPPGAFRDYLILVVDDNPTNLFLMETICQSIGLPYVTAVHGKDAVDKAKNFKFDLVFMDIQMPVMDGYTAIRELRKLDTTATTQIIALTASAMQEDVEKALGAGSTGFLGKPFERNQLLLCIAEHLGIPFERQLKLSPDTSEPQYETIVRNMYDFMREQYQISLGEIKLILAQTVSNWRPQLEDILVFAKKEQWPSVRKIMHTLKGQLGSIGLADFAETADYVNSRIKSGDTADLPPVLETFVSELGGVFQFIEENTAMDSQGRPAS